MSEQNLEGFNKKTMNAVLASLEICKTELKNELSEIVLDKNLNSVKFDVSSYLPVVKEPIENMENKKQSPVVGHAVTENTRLKEVLSKSLNQLMEIQQKKVAPKTLWGDDGNGNALWYENEFAILFGRTNTGKSIYAVQIAEHITKKLDMAVLYIDLEMSMKQFQLRYTSTDDKLHSWSDKLKRPDMSLIEWGLDNPEKSLELIKEMLDTSDAKILILDNLTFLINNGGMKADDVKPLCAKFCEWAKDGYSILAVNHTPKIKPFSPLDINDCLGSSMLTNFVQSVFAIGTDSRNPSTGRYVKQLKSRNGQIVWDANHVLTYNINKTLQPDMLRFIQPSELSSSITGLPSCMDTARESDLLKETKEAEHEQINKLHEEGKSNREIGKIMGMSPTTIGKKNKPIPKFLRYYNGAGMILI